MIQLTCEICGSTNLLKEDSIFLCQSCGAKYSVEEAKKLIMDHQNLSATIGDNKVEQSTKVKNLYQLARMDIDKAGCGNAQKYYEDILPEDPTSWEAHFFVEYIKCWNGKMNDLQYAPVAYSNCIESILNLIKTYVKSRAEQEDALAIVCDRTEKLFNLLLSAAKNKYQEDANKWVYLPEHRAPRAEEVFRAGFDKVTNQQIALTDFYDNCTPIFGMLTTLGNHIDQIFAEDDQLNHYAAKPWKHFIEHFLPLAKESTSIKLRATATEYISKIKKYDSAYAKCDLPHSTKAEIEDALSANNVSLAVKIYRNYSGKSNNEAEAYITEFSILNGIKTDILTNKHNLSHAESKMRLFGILGLTPYTFIAGIFVLCFIKKAKEENGGKLSKKAKRWLTIGVSSFFVWILLIAGILIASLL